MIQLRIHHEKDGFSEQDGIDGLSAALADEQNTIWVVVENATEAEKDSLEQTLHLHPMTREIIEHDEDRPKLRQLGDTIAVTFFAARLAKQDHGAVDFLPVEVVSGHHFMMSVIKEPLPEIAEAYERWKDNAPHLTNDSGAPLYTLLDTLVDGYFPIIDEIAERVDDVEDKVVEQQQSAALSDIFALKKSMLRFRRMAAGARDVVTVLLRHEMFGEGNDVYFQDVYDHVVRITDSVDTYRDLLSNAMDTYLSVTSNKLAESSNRLNVTMQTLTSWSIILGTGAVISGLYGMNVEGIPVVHNKHGFLDVLILMGAVATVLLWIFRRKKWI